MNPLRRLIVGTLHRVRPNKGVKPKPQDRFYEIVCVILKLISNKGSLRIANPQVVRLALSMAGIFPIPNYPRVRQFIFFAITCFFLMSCSTSRESPADSWPLIGNPCSWMNIETGQLTPANTSSKTVNLDPYYSSQTPNDFYIDDPLKSMNERELRADVELHVYPHMTVEGHYFGTGTHVFYLPNDGLFYLWGDDYMSHFDGMVGPFSGDPRIELARAASPASWLPDYVIEEENCEQSVASDLKILERIFESSGYPEGLDLDMI